MILRGDSTENLGVGAGFKWCNKALTTADASLVFLPGKINKCIQDLKVQPAADGAPAGVWRVSLRIHPLIKILQAKKPV